MNIDAKKTGAGRPAARWASRAGGMALVVCLFQAGGLAAQQVAGGAGDPRTLTLEAAVERAMDQSPQLQTARYALEEANERVREAWGSVYPSLDLSTTYTRNLSAALSFLPKVIVDPTAGPDELIALRFGADNLWSLSLNLDQPLFNAAAFVGVGAADRFRALQQEVVRGQVQEVVTRVRTAYYQLLLAQEQLRLLQNSVRRVEESLAETEALNEAGLVSDYDVLRLRVERANLLPNLRRAENAVIQGKRLLGVELALPDGEAEELSLAGSLAEMDIQDPGNNSADNQAILALAGVERDADPDSLVVTALTRRSDVRQLEATEDLRRTELRLQQVEYLPRLSLFGTYGINSQQNGDPAFFGEPRAYSRLAGIQLTLPLFQGFQRAARIDQKQAVVQQARSQTVLARSQAASQVRNLSEQVDEARLRAEGQALAVEQARQGYGIALAQYGEGLGSQLELTDAEVALRESEFNYAQAVYDYLVARAELDAAVGRVPMLGAGS